LRVSYKGDKKGQLFKIANNSYKILEKLLYKPIPAYKGGREDKLAA
jgi:hypothetical protein